MRGKSALPTAFLHYSVCGKIDMKAGYAYGNCETLEALKKNALADKDLREKLLATRKEKNPPCPAFCKLCTEGRSAPSMKWT